MANPNNLRPPSLHVIPSVPASPVDPRARRDSLASLSVSSHVDREQLAVTLDRIHTSASQSDALTTFNDFAPAPGAQPVVESKGTAGELVQQGLSGLYSRIKGAVTAVGKASSQGTDHLEGLDGAASKAPHAPAGHSSRAPVSPLPRDESGATASTYESTVSSDMPPSGTSSSGLATANSQSQIPQLSKTSSITTPSASNTPSASMQNLARSNKTSAAGTATSANQTAPGVVDYNVIRGTEEPPSRSTGRTSISRPADQAPRLVTSANPSLDNVANTDRVAVSGRSRRDDAHSLDGSVDRPRSPVKTSADVAGGPSSSSSSRLAPTEGARKPAIIDRISFARGANHSRSSSMEPGTAEASPISTSAHSSVYHDSFTHNERPQRLQSGAMKIPGTTTNEGAPDMVNARLERMRKQVLSKEFWMADETCKECFLCGVPFTAFRRKHHCRTCGCIFDSRCTSNISGSKFGVQGSLRVCKTCLHVINRRYDSGSDDSADEQYLPAIFRPSQPKPPAAGTPELPVPPKSRADDEISIAERGEQPTDDTRTASTPMMTIPTRRVGDSSNRNSAVLEIDMPQLSRPSSSRSLKSLSTSRPQSSGHRRHHSKHNFLTRLKASPDDRAPFRKPVADDPANKSNPNAFHADNIIDPELADFMSDESSGDEQMSIFAAMNSSELQPASFDPDRSSFGTYLNAGRKHRFRHGEKSTSGLSHTSRGGHDDITGTTPSGGLSIHTRPARRRNLSVASISVHHLRSPRPKSSAAAKGPSADALSIFDSPVEGSGSAGGLKRSDSSRDARPAEEGLNPASLQHVKKLFRQLLEDADVPNPASWEKALIPILDRCADDVDPDIRNGDDMDIRHWVKLKKLPGGRPIDTAYVHGVVFTKNLALKSMPRKIHNPRIVIVTFPIEYQRHPEQHFMSLQPVIEQEKEYLRMVVNRILNLEPQVLLVEKSVSGLALQYLAEANVAVAYNVKPSVIEAVSRIVNMPVISSMDMLSLGPRVGTCDSFEVKTYVNNEISGRKKTYIFLSGCPKDRGCTIALRGASTPILARMKRIAEFMIYVVYNLKLESCLMRDEFVQIPTDMESWPASASLSASTACATGPDSQAAGSEPTSTSPRPAILVTSQSTEGQQVLHPGTGDATGDMDPQQQQQEPGPEQRPQHGQSGDVDTTATPSPSITEPPAPTEPPIVQRLIPLHESHSNVASLNQVPEDVPMPTFYSDMVAKYQTRTLSASPFVRFTQPYLLMKAREQERRLAYLRRLRDQDIFEDEGESEKLKSQPFELIRPEMVHETGQKAPRQIMEVLHAVHDAEYDKALHNYQTQARQWENYIQGSLDLFDPYSHQNIVVLYSVTCEATKIPCSEPSLVAIEFYNERPDASGTMDQDCTLGQYIEDVCECADSVCSSNGCGRKLFEHYRTYVHDSARVTVIVENHPTWPDNFPEKPQLQERDGDEGTGICMWNYCKHCKKHFGLMPMSVSTWKYSFGKYLELSFWSRGLRLNPLTGCPHDHRKDHIRFFYYIYHDIAVRVHYDPIDLYEVVVPRPRITWKVDHDLRLKNDIFTKAEDRWNRFMASVHARIKSIRIDSVLPEKIDQCRAEVERLTKKAHEDQEALVRSLQETYMSSKYYEVIPFNAVMRQMLEKVTDWDAAFARFEGEFLSDKDMIQIVKNHVKKIWGDPESKEALPSTDGSVSVGSESDEKGTPGVSQSSAVESEKPSQTVEESQASQVSQASEGADVAPIPLQDTPLSPARESAAEVPAAVSAKDLSATAQTEQVLERVEPLDLATPSTPVLMQGIVGNPLAAVAVAAAASASDEAMSTPSPVPIQAPNPTSAPGPSLSRQGSAILAPSTGQMSLTEKVEQLRREQRVASSDATASFAGDTSTAESARPVPDRPSTASRKAGAAVSPPMVRAMSQPTGTLPRTQSTIGKLLLKEQRAAQDAAAAEAAKTAAEGTAKGEKKLSDRLGLGALKNRKAGTSGIPRYVHKRESKVSSLARHFEQISREFEKERIKDRKQRAAKIHHTRAFLPRSSTKTIVEVYKDVNQAVQEPGPSDEDPVVLDRGEQSVGGEQSAGGEQAADGEQAAGGKTTGATEDAGTDPAPDAAQAKGKEPAQADPVSPLEPVSQTSQASESAAGQAEADEHRPESRPASDDEGAGSDAENSAMTLDDVLPDVKDIAESLGRSGEEVPEMSRHQKKGMFAVMNSIFAEKSASNWTQLEYPINATDHILDDSEVIVREDEPSSLIAFALSHHDYKTKLAEIRQQMSNQRDTDDSSDGLQMKKGSGLGAATFGDEDMEKSLLRSTGTHLKYQFTEGSARMMCKIFYAEQFDALRRKCGAADRIVESLSRCLKWDSKGGKTKSVFLKTLDDRLVMKSLSPIETSSLLKFAPDYFNLMAETLFHDLPSVIAKMLGFFQIFIKNPLTNTEIKLDLLIMENLFYDRTPSRTFDLKGSMRNRRIQSTGERNEVLLDENMVEYIYESPLFAREHSKKVLRLSVWNDTLFLARQHVMDYSLMVAVDEEKKELVVGIIDCIRTYTWDKQVESWIKNRGFAGGGRNRPTVTSPKEYKSRFREAMARYILQAPNCWHTFGNQLPPITPATPRTRFEGDV